RLAAGALAVLAIIKLLLTFRPSAAADDGNDYDWSWISVRKPAIATGLMLGYLLLFRVVPFPLITAIFVTALFWTFGVRPLWRLLVGSAVATATLYGLFVFLMRVPL